MKRFVSTTLERLIKGNFDDVVTPTFGEWFRISFYRKTLQKENPRIKQFTPPVRLEHSKHEWKVSIQMQYDVRLAGEAVPITQVEEWYFAVERDQLLLDSVQFPLSL